MKASFDLSPKKTRNLKKKFMKQDLSAAAIKRINEIRTNYPPWPYPLLHAVSKQTRESTIRIGMMKFALERGDDINELHEYCLIWYGGRPLHCVVDEHSYIRNPALEVLQFLLENGADPDAKDLRGYTPLARIEEELVQSRIAAGTDPDPYIEIYSGAQKILKAAIDRSNG